MGETVLTNAWLVTPEEIFLGTVQIKESLICAVERGRSYVRKSIDLEGDYLLPGLIELHTDHLEMHCSPRPGVNWPPVAAIVSHDAAIVAAGITTVFDALAIGDIVEDSPRLQGLRKTTTAISMLQEKGRLRAEHFLHIRCELAYPKLLDHFENLAKDPLTRMVSLMDHTPGQRQFTRREKFFQYYQGKHGLSQQDVEAIISLRRENQIKFSARHRAVILKMCRELRIPLASHDDTTTAHIEEAAADGILVAEFPTTVEAARAARAYGLHILMGAPNLVLGGSHSGNISARELGKLNLLDILSSDYVPGSLVQGIFLLHNILDIPLPQAVSTVTVQPAKIVGLQDRGALELSKIADLIQVKPVLGLPVVRRVWKSGRTVF